MNLRLRIVSLILSLSFISATSASKTTYPLAPATLMVGEDPSSSTLVKKQRLTFIKKFILKRFAKKFNNADEVAKADRQASTSLSFGIAAVSLLLIGVFVPFVILATIPTGIVALVAGGTALKGGTKETSKARTGRSLGMASLIALGALLIIGIMVLASFSGWG